MHRTLVVRLSLADQPYPMLEEPGIRRFMAESDSLYPADAVAFTMAEQRAFYDRLCAHFRKARPPGVTAEDRDVLGPGGPIAIRIYRPSPEQGLPVVLYLHGGGKVVGGLDSHDDICAELADRSGTIVVAVDYRLAPEHRFPAAFDDCWSVLEALADGDLGIGADRIVVAGDSAGGNLAAVVALMARDRSGPALRHQVLLYPVVDHDFDRPSYRANADGYLLTRDTMRWFWQQYVADPARRSEGYASPQRADKLEGLPSATVITAEYDPLRDEGEAYAERLRAAGVTTIAMRYDGQIHGFASLLDILDAGKRAVDEIGATLRAELA